MNPNQILITCLPLLCSSFSSFIIFLFFNSLSLSLPCFYLFIYGNEILSGSIFWTRPSCPALCGFFRAHVNDPNHSYFRICRELLFSQKSDWSGTVWYNFETHLSQNTKKIATPTPNQFQFNSFMSRQMCFEIILNNIRSIWFSTLKTYSYMNNLNHWREPEKGHKRVRLDSSIQNNKLEILSPPSFLIGR